MGLNVNFAFSVALLLGFMGYANSRAGYQVEPAEEILETSDQQFYSSASQTINCCSYSSHHNNKCRSKDFRRCFGQPPSFYNAVKPRTQLEHSPTCSNLEVQLTQYLRARGCLQIPRSYLREDPYYLYLLQQKKQYLPLGLGPQGIYGSTGLPAYKPPGVFMAVEKVDHVPWL